MKIIDERKLKIRTLKARIKELELMGEQGKKERMGLTQVLEMVRLNKHSSSFHRVISMEQHLSEKTKLAV